MRNNIIIIGFIVGLWFCLKVIDYLVPWPAILCLLCITLVIMVTHSTWLLLAQSQWLRKTRKIYHLLENTPWEPWVDIFIPAKNEARVIETCVRNLCSLDYKKYYIWVIDDASEDNTASILEKLKGEFPRLKVVSKLASSYSGKSAALNEALPLAKGEVIAVFDADAHVAPDFLAKMLPVLIAEEVGAVQCQKKIYPSQQGFLVDCQASEYALDTYFQTGRNLIGGAVELRGNGQLIKRAALIDVGGWNNKAITDDLDLTMRLLLANWDTKFCSEAVVWEEGVTTLSGLIRQRKRWAEGSIRRYLDYIFPLNSPRRLSLVDRLDILAFFSFFAVPALMLLEVISEVFSFAAGRAIHTNFLILVASVVFVISIVNFFIAIRIYRNNLNFIEALFHSFEVNTYVFAHWVPCVLLSFMQILLRQQVSKWQRTEHLGDSIQPSIN